MDRHCYPSALQIVIQSLILISSIIVFHIQSDENCISSWFGQFFDELLFMFNFYSLYVIMHLPIRFVVLFIDEARCLKCILEYF